MLPDEHTFPLGIRPKSIRKPRDAALEQPTASKQASKGGDVWGPQAGGKVSSPDERAKAERADKNMLKTRKENKTARLRKMGRERERGGGEGEG